MPPRSNVELPALRFQLSLSRKTRTADRGSSGLQLFTITHPFHPLKGQTFEVLAVRNNWGGDRVSYLSPEGRLRTVPMEWADVCEADLATTIGAGRAVFRADFLRDLRRLVDEDIARGNKALC